MAKEKELPEVVLTERGKLLTLPKSIAMAYRNRSFERFYKRGVRQAAAALLGCNVGDVHLWATSSETLYYCRKTAVKHPQDLGQPAEPRKRYKPRSW